MSFSSHFLRICIYNTPPLLLGIRKSVLVLHHTICSIICIFLFILACSQRQQIRTHSFQKKKISAISIIPLTPLEHILHIFYPCSYTSIGGPLIHMQTFQNTQHSKGSLGSYIISLSIYPYSNNVIPLLALAAHVVYSAPPLHPLPPPPPHPPPPHFAC